MDVTGYKPQETCCLLLKNGGRLTFSFQVDTSFEARSLDARLYNADVSRDLRTSLVEEYANEERPTDGEIYRKIRRYHFERSVTLERRWWTWLTPHGAKPLKQLLRNDLLTAAFDALLKIPGVWVGMRISTLLKMLAIRCDEANPPLTILILL